MSESPGIDALRASKLFDLTGKVAVVTGGSRGMGKEICRAFAAAGASVIISSRKLDTCEALVKQIQGEVPGSQVLAFACNVSRWEDCQLLFDFAYSRFSHVDILVNNAGASPLYPSLREVSEQYFDKVMGLNLKGPFRLAALFASRMCEQQGGSIINVSSNSSLAPTARESVYAAAKAGLNSLTKALAVAYGPKVRVNCLMPGPFLTDISNAWDLKETVKALRAGQAMMRAGRPDEVVGAALYFASEASSFTTGAILEVAGGPGAAGGRDPYHKKSLDYQRDVLPEMRDRRLSKL